MKVRLRWLMVVFIMTASTVAVAITIAVVVLVAVLAVFRGSVK